jgi:hypothetical protein
MKATALLLACLFAAPAQAFTASNSLEVTASGAAGFTVAYGGPSGPSDFWCAAGDFAIQKLGQQPSTRIYRVSEPPRRSGEGIRFSLDPESAAHSTGLLIVGAKGGSLTAAMAQSFCEIRRNRHQPR